METERETNSNLTEGQEVAERNPMESEMPSYSRHDLAMSDLPIIARISLMLLRIVTLQKWMSVPRLVASFDAPHDQAAAGDIDIGRINWLSRGVLRRLFRSRYCMKRSLILFHYLRKSGRDARIIFGVVKENGKLEGHAWVTVNGTPFAEEGPVDRYSVTYAYP